MPARYEITDAVLKTVSLGGAVAVFQAGAGASAQITDPLGSNLTVYQAETGATTVANPLTVDSAGRIEGWTETPNFNVVISGPGITTYTQKVRAFDPAAANDITGLQTFTAGSTALSKISTDGLTAPELHFLAKNGSRANGLAWGIGVDVGAATPSRDLAIFKALSSGVSDLMYFRHNGANAPSVVIGQSSPGYGEATVEVWGPANGSGVTTEATIAGLVVRQGTGATAPAFVVRRGVSGTNIFAVYETGLLELKDTSNTLQFTVLANGTVKTTASQFIAMEGNAGETRIGNFGGAPGIFFTGAGGGHWLLSTAAGVIKCSGKLTAVSGLGVGNAITSATVSGLTKTMQVFDADGTALGHVPIYSTRT